VGSGSVAPVLVLNGETATNFTVTSQNGTWTIAPASVTAAAGSYSGTYDGAVHSPSACAVTGAYTGDLSCTNDPVSVGPDVGSGSVIPVLVLNGETEANFTIIPQNGSWEITKANPTCAINGYTGVYDGDPHGAFGSCTGVKGETLTGLDLGETFTDVPGGTADWTFTDTSGNYNNDSSTVDIVINKAAATIVVAGYEGVYDGQPHSATLTSATGVNSEDLSGSVIVGTQTYTNVPGGTVAWSFEHNNYQSQNGTVDITINKAAATIDVAGYEGVYDGQSHGATLTSATGVNSEDLSGSVAVGTETFTNVPGGTAYWTFTDTSGNYKDDSGSVAIVINKADATIVVNGTTVTYDGEEHGATGSATGVKGDALAGLDLGAKFTNVPGGIANWTFTDETGNYNDASGSAKIVISKADPTCTISGYTGVYDGDPHGASGSCTGVKGETLTTLKLGEIFTNVPGGTASWTFTDSSGNYKDDSGSVKIVIDKATPTCTINGYTGVYDGDPHGASGSCTGVKGETLSTLKLGEIFTNVPGGTASWTFTDSSGNYKDDSGSVKIVIDKATPTCTINGYTGVYDGDPHGASGSCTGVKGETLTTLKLGETFTNVPGGTASWTFTDSSGNYNDDSGSVKIVIDKATPTCTINGYTGVYDGDPHGASGSCTGVKGETLTTLKLGETFTNVPGGTASWTFTDSSGNYNDDSGSVKIVIDKATPTCTINGYTGVYDGDPHGASGSCTGVKGETLTTLKLGETFTNVPGGTASWTFTDSTGNYNDDSGSVNIVITKTNPTCSINGYTGIYDGEPHGALGACIGVKYETLAELSLGAKFTNVPGGTTNWRFNDVTGNYNNASGTVEIVINKANPSCSISGYTGIYEGDPHGASGSCTGVKSETLASLDLGGSFTDVPGGTASWTFTDETGNYNDDSGMVNIVISKAAATIVVAGYEGLYDGQPHGATLTSATGVNGEELSDSVTVGTDTFTNVPGGQVAWSFEHNNYEAQNGTVDIVIKKATLTVTADDQTAQYSDASPALTFKYSGFIGSEGPDDLTTKPSCSTTRQIMSPAGSYPITCSGGVDDNYTFSYVDGAFTVTKESAGITYTGDTQVTTAKAKAKAKVTFAATLEEQQDGWLGDQLSGQKILFEIYSFGGSLVASCTAPVDHVVNGKGYGSCTIDLPAADPYQVKVSLVKNGYYKADVESVVVLVNDPGTGMATGGGWLIDPNTGSRVSFGFTTKFLKNGRIQGNSLFIYRVITDLSTIVPGAPVGERDYNWIIKSNAMQGLYIYDCTVKTTTGCKATITGKNTVQAVDRETGVLYSIGGNYQFQVDVTDNQEPGSSGTGPDQYAIRVWDSSGTYYELGDSYDDHGMLISPLDITAGNIQVKAKK
jgi:hypothetical protein